MLSGWTTVGVPTNSGCPGEGDRTEGQEQVAAPKKMTRQWETSKMKRPVLLYTFPTGGEEFRGPTPPEEYRRGVDDNLLCLITVVLKRVPTPRRRSPSNGIQGGMALGVPLKSATVLHSQVLELLSSCGSLSIQQHDHNSLR